MGGKEGPYSPQTSPLPLFSQGLPHRRSYEGGWEVAWLLSSRPRIPWISLSTQADRIWMGLILRFLFPRAEG